MRQVLHVGQPYTAKPWYTVNSGAPSSLTYNLASEHPQLTSGTTWPAWAFCRIRLGTGQRPQFFCFSRQERGCVFRLFDLFLGAFFQHARGQPVFSLVVFCCCWVSMLGYVVDFPRIRPPSLFFAPVRDLATRNQFSKRHVFCWNTQHGFRFSLGFPLKITNPKGCQLNKSPRNP